ncbi:MAG: hypothetical protein P8X82_07205 [Gemmatimonadales bacterium]
MKRHLLSCVLCVMAFGLPKAVAGQSAQYDILIVGGQVLDGTGNPWFYADVGIRGDRIAAVGQLDGATADRTIEARGKTVVPGFIDIHYMLPAPSTAHVASGARTHVGVRPRIWWLKASQRWWGIRTVVRFPLLPSKGNRCSNCISVPTRSC